MNADVQAGRMTMRDMLELLPPLRAAAVELGTLLPP